MQSGSDIKQEKHTTRKARATFQGSAAELSPLLPQLSHKMGHEIGNPLTSIISLATIVERFADGATEKNQQYARSIISEAWKISTIVEKVVLLFSDRDGSPGECPLDSVLQRALAKLKSRGAVILDDIVLRIEDEAPPAAYCDQDQLCTAIIELITNAADADAAGRQEPESAFGEGEPVVIRIYTVGEASCIEVSNTISAAVPMELAELFEPLATTSATQKSLGIGLSMVAKVAQRFSGVLEVEEAQRGETLLFVARLVLPARKGADISGWDGVGSGSAEAKASGPAQSGEAQWPEELRVLVVEDQEVVASAIKKILEFALKEQSTVSCCCVGGAKAAELLSAGEDFDVILCDLNLSSMDGRSIYGLIAREQPERLSGFAFMTAERRPDIDRSIPCLNKPFEPEDLITLVVKLITS